MLGIVILISSLAVGVKRLHDRNKSGWYLVLFYIVPGILMAAAIAAGVFMEDSIDRRRPRVCGRSPSASGLSSSWAACAAPSAPIVRPRSV